MVILLGNNGAAMQAIGDVSAGVVGIDGLTATIYVMGDNSFTLRWATPDDLRLEHDVRSLPVAALSDGTYVVTRGPGMVAHLPFTLGRTAELIPTINLAGFDPLVWLTGSNRQEV